MGEKLRVRRSYASTEVVGGLILLVIAVVAFAAIYLFMYPQGPDIDTSVKISGYVNDEGAIILEHYRGETITKYNITLKHINGTSIESEIIENDNWRVGELRYPLEQLEVNDMRLVNETISMNITVFIYQDDDSIKKVFDATLTGKLKEGSGSGSGSESNESEESMLITSLKTQSTEEDLICFNDTINISEYASTYIYNWMIDGSPICYLYYPFDTNNNTETKDYSDNDSLSPYNFDTNVINATWNANGVVGGAYYFDSDDYIELPYCCDISGYIDEITIEMWIKTNEDAQIITSLNKSRYFEIGINNGKLVFSNTNNNGETVNTTGDTIINDNQWHHIAFSYDSQTGENIIYVDGDTDIIEQSHSVGDLIGDSSKVNGFIGRTYGLAGSQTIGGKTSVFDDTFQTNKGWTVVNDCTDGEWERDDPVGFNRGDPWSDSSDSGDKCYLTDNDNYNSDVDGGYTYLISPTLDLSGGVDAIIEYEYWYRNDVGSDPENDIFKVYVSNNNGGDWTLVEEFGPETSYGWKDYSFIVGNYVTISDQVKIKFEISDLGEGSIVEGGIDNFHASIIGELTTVFSDNFELDNGWTTYDDCADGEWERDDPVGYDRGDPDNDFDGTGNCFLTDNANYNSDVDDGYTYLFTPSIDCTSVIEAQIHFAYWYTNDFGSNPDNNFFKLYVSDDGGSDWELVKVFGPESSSGWKEYWFILSNYVSITDEIKVCFEVSDIDRGAVVEAAIDDFSIEGILPEETILENNFTGYIDEFRVYNRTLTPEQVYQNYLCTKDGETDRSVIVSEETNVGDIWSCIVTPNNGAIDFISAPSDPIQIINYIGGG